MNEDIYAEWLIKRKAPGYRYPVYLVFIVLMVFAVILFLRFNWGVIVLAAVVIGFLFVRRFLNIEYEYVFVTNELSIDKIYSQSSRKNAVKIDMSSVESVELTNPERNKNLLAGKDVVFQDYTSRDKDKKSYTIIYTGGGRRCVLTFEPNDKVLNAMWRCAPSKVKIAK